jgi:hypothetical protein
MRLINYNYGYNNTFNCSIHGKIVVTQKEWERIEKYVLNPSVTKESFFRNILKGDIKRIVYTDTGTLLNIRVNATQAVVNKFNIKGYKRGNYTFLVKYNPKREVK